MPILKSLFARKANGAAPLYDRLVAEARRHDWYVEGGIADTIDGRFAVLATLVSRAIVRLEEEGEDGIRDSAQLTERFISDMDAQMREQGFDTTLGKKVRKLVGAMGGRAEAWRGMNRDEGDAIAAVAADALAVEGVSPNEGAVELLRSFDSRMSAAGRSAILGGNF